MAYSSLPSVKVTTWTSCSDVSARLPKPTSARFGTGLDRLTETIAEVASGRLRCKPRRVMARARALERAVERVAALVHAAYPRLPNSGWVAQRLLDGDQRIASALRGGELEALQRPDLVDGQVDRGSPDAAEILTAASELLWQVGPDFHESIMESVYAEAGRITDLVVTREGKTPRVSLDRTIDRLGTSRIFGFPLMLGMLTVVFWLTIAGANVPSKMLATLLLDRLHPLLSAGAASIGMPWWLSGFLLDGVYLATAWVISVMLPPMAIFFPLFTLLEDFGYLPRVAFNLDRAFKRVGAHGKQALTTAMGFSRTSERACTANVTDNHPEVSTSSTARASA